MNRTRGLRAYTTVEHAGRVYRPLDPHEHFPYFDISRAQVDRGSRPLGADPKWREDPMGASTIPPERRAVAFACEGPDAEEAMEAIKGAMSAEPGAVFGVGHTLAGLLATVPGAMGLGANAWRPPGYRPDPGRTAAAAVARMARGRPQEGRRRPSRGHPGGEYQRWREEQREAEGRHETGGYQWP